jgi:two-component system chemotaxis sensor kinase CheA
MDDEILQDFLVEAQEILDNLDSQLINLEGSPNDQGLLNAVFRSFHTIKGGAGFLSLDALVEVAHKCEDVFDQLRNGKFSLNAQVMDVFLRVLDSLREMFDALRSGKVPSPAAPALLEELRLIASGQFSVESPSVTSAPEPVETTVAIEANAEIEPPDNNSIGEFDDVVAGMLASVPDASGMPAGASQATSEVAPSGALISDDEFESLLDTLQAKRPVTPLPAAPDLITDDEFESLLDNLKSQKAPIVDAPKIEAAPAPAPAAAPVASSGPDIITDDEFERLLDKLNPAAKVEEPAKPASKAADRARPKKEPAPTAAAEGSAVVDAPIEASVEARPPKRKPVEPKEGGADKSADSANADANTIRVGIDVLDRIMNMVGELVLIRNRLSNLQVKVADPEVTQAVSNLDVVTSDLQMAAMKTRMQPIKKVFGRFPRVVRDLARNLGKEVELEMAGEDTDLDKNLVEALSDPLVHLVRNAVDHGIELPAARLAAGKPKTGTLRLSAEQDGDQILLTIQDDGKGMNAEILRAKSVEKGLLEEDAALRLTERECFELIFLPGFSTKDEISDVSGRGVGMDVVKTRITQLNGAIEIDSKVGVGTTIRIRVPLTLAIMPTLMVHLGRQIFALPLMNVKEIIDFRREQAHDVDGRKSLVVRGRALPLFYLSRWLIDGVYDVAVDEGHVVIVSVGSQSIGLIVDELLGQEEVVIKPLGAMLHGTRGLSGATITGDGRIALILDLPELLDVYGRR